MLVSNWCFPLWAVFLLWLPQTLAVRDPPLVLESSIQDAGQPFVCPAVCTCDHLTQHRATLDCRDQGLSNVPTALPNATVKLFLDGNALQAFENLGPMPALEVVTLTHNALSNLPPDAFRSLPRLKHLDLSANRLRNQLPSYTFRGLSYLQYLNVSSNFLGHISNLQFQGLSSLVLLDLSRNTLSQLDRDAFKELKSLETLDLSQNQLSHLQQEWFQGLSNLRKLVLSQNKIQSISNILFWSLNNLRTLDLSHNVISLVGRLSFKGLVQVVKLNLSHNNITILQEGTTQNMKVLEDIDLSHNPLVMFDGTFRSSPSILYLRLDHTERLRELTANSLQGLSGLTHLHLSHSALSKLHPRAFTDLVKLLELHLSRSQLRTMPIEILKPLTMLEHLYLQGNPWHCDCLLHWLLRWQQDHKGHMVHSPDTLCQTPQTVHGSPILDALDHHLTCLNASTEPLHHRSNFFLGSDALLSCIIEGYPKPTLTWLTPRNIMLHLSSNSSSINQHPSIHGPGGDDLNENDVRRFELFSNGSLKVKHVSRADTGTYRCMASNALSNSTSEILLTLNGAFVQEIKLMSIWVGLATSGGFLLLTLVGQFVSWVMVRCGWECPCCTHLGSRKGQQLWKVLENMETYKSQQLDRLRENYTNQVQKIKDNCMQQMEWLRESYSCQVERLRDIRDYGTQQIDRIRDNYNSQVQKVRDYSTSQIDRLRENYIFQRTRIRKFSAHQLLKLRENYKLQQQHLNKILENLNLDNCKANCSRTDSMIFESSELAIQPAFHNPALAVDLVHLHLDYAETGSQISAYFTPNDSGSETSSPISDKHQPPWEPRLLATPRKKRARPPDIPKVDVGSSTTDLHLFQSSSPDLSSTTDTALSSAGKSEVRICATDSPQSLPSTSSDEVPIEDNIETAPVLENDSSTPKRDRLALPLHNTKCTLGQQLSGYTNHGSQDLNHLESIECHSGATVLPQDSVTETIV